MVGLLDIAPVGEKVTIDGKEVECIGVSVKGLALLIMRFPELKGLLNGNLAEFTADRLFQVAPDAIAAIIAAGTGTPGDDKAEKIAASLPLETQYDLLAAIGRRTMPGGAGPFVERINALSELALGFAQGVEKTRATKSPPQSSD